MDYKEKFENFLDKMQGLLDNAKKQGHIIVRVEDLENAFPELRESNDERIRKMLIEFFSKGAEYNSSTNGISDKDILAWLEKQGSEPNWCHHKVDLSNCSEEYCKAYYDGWNNCNQQHSQCKSEWNDVVKCLINGMKFYYENNEEATWGTEKFSMKVKDILSWLEKQGEKKHFDYENANIQQKDFAPNDEEMKELLRTEYEKGRADAIAEMQKDWSEDDEERIKNIISVLDWDGEAGKKGNPYQKEVEWLKSIKDRVLPQPKWSEEDAVRLKEAICMIEANGRWVRSDDAVKLVSDWLKSLKERCTWKPSEEQIECLHDAINHYQTNGYPASKLNELYEQMSKIYKL